jgi:hypothetical protein
MRAKLLTIAVFALSFLLLGWNAGEPSLATSYVDPVGKIVAQDEALYAASSQRMAERGDWMTPMFMGRLALYKPPVLYWLSGASVKLLGKSALAIRIPSILAGAVTATLIFVMLRAAASLLAAFTGTVLLLGSHLFFMMSRVGLTDALLMLAISVGMYALSRDPRLAATRWMVVFGIASGAAIMIKSTAGAFPMLILIAFCLVSRERPTFARLVQVALITAAVALPWHLWQLAMHPRWFWNEYIMTEQVGWGLGAKSQSTNETHAGYYLRRLWLLDPVLAIAAVAALFKSRPRWIVAWMAVILLGCMAFQYRNTSYLLPVYPALTYLVASAIPSRFGWVGLAVSVGLFAMKAAMPSQPWGLPYAPETMSQSHVALDAYQKLHRGNTLIIVEPDDQLYAADLDLPHVQYVYLNPEVTIDAAPLDFSYLGITLTAEQFARLPELRPAFAQRLREWNLDSEEPIATVILAPNQAAIQALIAAHPEYDFFVPEPPEGHGFRLAREKIERP